MTALSVADDRPPGDSLPAELTSYVGRHAEINEARRLLEAGSLVTFTGPGGVGKTRLAQRVATGLRGGFADGALFVPLAELHEPDLLPSTVAELLQLGDRSARPTLDVLVDALRGRKLLLVLDNCEHLVEACAELVDAVLHHCPNVVVLATSRQSLGVAGERILPVGPLAIPEPGEPSFGLDRYDAVKLFVDRATAVVPSFQITDDNADDVIQLCRQLEGLPLAIELAAVRLRALSVRQIAERLHEQLRLLTGGSRSGPSRHETLRALIDWSHERCTEQEQLLWARVSVFAGSFELDAAEEVCAGEGLSRDAVLDVIDGLLDKSILLREEQHGVVRYRMLETMRQYGEDRLRAAGELVRLRQRHRDWYLALTSRFEQEWIGPNQLEWSDRLRREHPNLRAALDFCASDPDEAIIGLRLARTFKEFWLIRGSTTEGRIHLKKLVDMAAPDAPGRAHALWIYAFFALVQSDMPAYEQTLATASEVADAAGDESAKAYVLHVRGYADLIGNAMPAAVGYFGAAVEQFRQQDDIGGELWARYNYGISVALAGDLERGRQVLKECIEAYTARGEVFWRCWALWSLGAAEYLAGELQLAREATMQVLRLELQVRDRVIIAFALTVAAGCAAHSGQDRRAAKLFGAAAIQWQSLGASPTHYAAFIKPMEADTDAVTGRLGWEKAAAEFSAGYVMSTDEAMAYALEDEPATTVAGLAAPPESPLTKREQQIAELVAKGMTNREIAQTLVIAQRTAETHVDHILTKLGFTNRAQIAAWVVDTHRS